VRKHDKFGKVLGAIILVVGVVYLTYKIPFWIDSFWRTFFCYLAALLLVLAGITLIAEYLDSNKEV
jgi:hypothetical protein